jgi:hypothetical protein
MDRESLLVRIEQRARLHGPNETRRAVGATLEALGAVLPQPIVHRLLMRIPADVRHQLPAGSGLASAPRDEVENCRDFIGLIGRRLHIDEPDAAFLARVIFEQLNRPSRGLTPAGVAHLAPGDLRPLLTARLPEAVSQRPTHTMPAYAVTARRRTELGTVIAFPVRADRPVAGRPAAAALTPVEDNVRRLHRA